ncbi:MAG: DUF3047 domain-containing protein [Deltaproteobacteria bacterium]|nr:DUF3047 domain-containing protein [Deltaproteobacteria bacterium]
MLIFLLSSLLYAEESIDSIAVGHFSGAKDLNRLPDGWDPLYFQNIPVHTDYKLVDDNGLIVIQAVSKASSSGLTRKITVNPLEYPILSWSWKVGGIYEKGDVTRKEGDDYPARLYITFSYDPARVGLWERARFETIKLFYGEYPPINALNYIWTSNGPSGLITPNPYTDRVKMIVIESGAEKLNQWVFEQRDIAADYRKAFGQDPPAISGVAVMTDSDNTGESATAWYGDIVFTRRRDAAR